MSSNPRKGTYGYTVRIDCATDLSVFKDITAIGSASAAVSSMSFNLSASTLFVGNSTIYSSTEGLTFNSGEWVYFQPLTAEAFVTADTYTFHVEASATGVYFKSPDVTISVDP